MKTRLFSRDEIRARLGETGLSTNEEEVIGLLLFLVSKEKFVDAKTFVTEINDSLEVCTNCVLICEQKMDPRMPEIFEAVIKDKDFKKEANIVFRDACLYHGA